MEHDFQYISRHDPKVKEAYEDLMQLLREVRAELRSEFTFQYEVVGSYARNMITYDAKGNKGYDFDVNIYPNTDEEDFTPKQIKARFQAAIDRYCQKHGYDHAEDSTRVLTIKVKNRENGQQETAPQMYNLVGFSYQKPNSWCCSRKTAKNSRQGIFFMQ